MAGWDSKWETHKGPSGGRELSVEVQKQHKAFKQMGEATNSVSALKEKDEGGTKTWVWVEGGESTATVADLKNIEAEVFEMEYLLG